MAGDIEMSIGNFYFIKEAYFVDFPDKFLMGNNDRPCFYSFQDSKTKLLWMIPFSSKTNKFRNIYNRKMEKYGRCDTVVFGHILGHEKAFLIQNMCPITTNYIENVYIEKRTGLPVKIDGALENEILEKSQKALTLQRKGKSVIFPDVLYIEKKLLENNCK